MQKMKKVNATTNIEFHKKMKGLAAEYLWNYRPLSDEQYNENIEYYRQIKGLTQEEIFKKFEPIPDISSSTAKYEYVQRERKNYLKGIADINYELARQISGDEDLILEVSNKQKITIPFYFQDLHSPMQYEIKDNQIEFKKDEELKISKINGEYYEQYEDIIYVANIKDNVVMDYKEERRLQEIDAKNLKEYYVHWELYSSYFVDPGGMDTIWAHSEEDAVRISQSIHDSPEDGEIYSYRVSGKEYGNERVSYENVIEKPGIEKAEMSKEPLRNIKEINEEPSSEIKEQWTQLVKEAEKIARMIDTDIYYKDLHEMLLQAKTIKEFLDHFKATACLGSESVMNEIFKSYTKNEYSISIVEFYEKMQNFDGEMEREKKEWQKKKQKYNKQEQSDKLAQDVADIASMLQSDMDYFELMDLLSDSKDESNFLDKFLEKSCGGDKEVLNEVINNYNQQENKIEISKFYEELNELKKFIKEEEKAKKIAASQNQF